jgi:hypothetical protein
MTSHYSFGCVCSLAVDLQLDSWLRNQPFYCLDQICGAIWRFRAVFIHPINGLYWWEILTCITCIPVFGVRGRFRGVKRRKPLPVTFFFFFFICAVWIHVGIFSGSRPLADSVCARKFLYSCPVLKPAQMQDSVRAQTNWACTNAGLTRTNGHSAPNSAVSTHNYAPIVGRILQTRGWCESNGKC